MPFDTQATAAFINPVTGKPFAGAKNLAALAAAGMGSEWATFSQWKSVGRIVRKGERGTKLRGPGFAFHVFAHIQTDSIEALSDPSKVIAKPVTITPMARQSG